MDINIIKILPNIILSNNFNIDTDYIKNNFISNIIIINSDSRNIEETNFDNELYQHINIQINETNLDFTNTNNQLINILKKSQNILIISDKNILGFVIISAFMINELDVSFFQILLLDKLYNININNTNYSKLLYNYYITKKT